MTDSHGERSKQKMQQEYEETVNEMLGATSDSEIKITDRAVVGLMLCKRLDRIADALESIQQSTETLEALSDCISSSKYGDQFCITGSITAYEP